MKFGRSRDRLREEGHASRGQQVRRGPRSWRSGEDDHRETGSEHGSCELMPPGKNYTIVGPESLAGGFSETENSTSKLDHSHLALHHPPPNDTIYASLGVFVYRYNLPRGTRAGVACRVGGCV